MTTGRALKAIDVALVAVLAVTAQLDVWSGAAGPEGGPLVHAALAALITVPLVVRHRYPLAVIGLVSGASWIQYELGGGLYQPWFAMLLATYALGAHAGLPQSAIGLAPVAGVVLAVDLPKLIAGAPPEDVIPVWVIVGLVWVAGRWVRRRRRETSALRAVVARAAEEREASAAAAVAGERARIARELHDLVAHSMSVINLQAQGARRVLPDDPAAAIDALEAIDRASRQGLDEMRRLLSLLRTNDERPTLQPQPGLDDLGPLVDHVRAAGLDVRLTVEGERRPLGSGVELAAYRVVQEALTNALKHSESGSAAVLVRYGAADVEVEVRNAQASASAAGTPTSADPPTAEAPAARPGLGMGLVGMRERVILYGGAFEAGGEPGGPFVVRVRLPTADAGA